MTPSSFCTENVGSGKTLYMCYRANLFFERNKVGKVYANFHLFKNTVNPKFREKDFIYTPLGLLPLSEFENKEPKLVLLDDSEAIKNLDDYFDIITGMSRKSHIDVIIIGHYYADINKRKRTLLQYKLKVNYLESRDILEAILIDNENINYPFGVRDILKYCKELYDTYEVVKKATPSLIEREIKRFSKSLTDLEHNLKFLYKGKRDYERELKKYKEVLGFN